MDYDVAIIGSGMGGSVCAAILAKLGYKVVMIERGSHPRFALGESGTPAQARKMRFLGERYGIPEIATMANYTGMSEADCVGNSWPKELFQYFLHTKGSTAIDEYERLPEIIVQTPEIDVQYFRASADMNLVHVATKYGATFLDRTTVEDILDEADRVRIELRPTESTGAERSTIGARFVVDASGGESFFSRKLDLIERDALDIPLKSRCIFTHFEKTGSFDDLIAASKFEDISPVPRKLATQHHCFPGGWIWFIPFADGVTSVGVNLDMDLYPMNDLPAEEEFWKIVRDYPIVYNLLKDYRTVRPFVKTKRLQFLAKQMAGDRWAMLSSAATGLDAWFSSGLVSTLASVHRVVELLDTVVFRNKRFDKSVFAEYEQSIRKEYALATKMVNGMYKAFKNFDVFEAYCFVCFIGMENYMKRGGIPKAMDRNHLVFNAGDDVFVAKFETVYGTVVEYAKRERLSKIESESVHRFLVDDLKDFNFRGYGDPRKRGVYPYQRAVVPAN